MSLNSVIGYNNIELNSFYEKTRLRTCKKYNPGDASSNLCFCEKLFKIK